jgi:hypothetical protein
MQGIVIQGPTNYANQILDSYDGISNIVWSTWIDEPELNIELIKSKGIEVVQIEKPSIEGHLNVNFQTLSSYVGIDYLKSKGITEILKIRGDLKINNVELLLELLKGRKISFLSICKPNVRPLYYELVYRHTSFDFPSDLLLYGKTEEIEKCFNFQVDNSDPIPPESLIAYSYLSKSNIDFNLDYNHFIKSGISFFAQDCLNNKIEIDWLKRSNEEPFWKNILNHSGDKNLYEY